jgi:16S rRNA (uracil1498-N3)-methyltransferase
MKRVLRLAIGERVVLFDGLGFEYVCEIGRYTEDAVVLNVVEKRMGSGGEGGKKVTLYMALVKKDNFEWIVQKATELGVSDIVPVVADRSEKKNLNTERLSKIIIEAAEQSGRIDLPRLHEIISLSDAITLASKNPNNSMSLDPTGKSIKEAKDGDFTRACNGIFIGPEGGWTEKEIEAFKSAGIDVLSLGPQILRAETAAVAGLAIVILG